MIITGFSPSVVRAVVMGIIAMLGKILYRKNDMWTSIAISLLITLIYNPFLINNLGVLLSYSGTIGILMFNKTTLNLLEKIKIKNKKYKYKITRKIKKIIKYIREIFAVTISAQIMIIPITIIYFNKIGLSYL